MKTNTSGFVFNWFNSLIVAIVLVLLNVITTANAQTNVNVLDGLFTPTQSERFFQAGRKNFEQEVEIFNNPERYLGNDLLQIDPELIEQMERPMQPADFGLDNYQYELYPNSNTITE
ncbi:MAG: hypothetical protein QNJ53_27800 [Pleurocapsa sp. MO_192.B19]|nr:hypothetical protein [Pleurocapsa sp. MO_192.B19]